MLKKACIHPSHVPVIRGAFHPADEMIAWAQGVIATAESVGAVFRYQGRMIDEFLLRQARTTLARAGVPPV